MLPPRRFRIVSCSTFDVERHNLLLRPVRLWEVWELGMESSPVAVRRSRRAALNYARKMGIVVEEV